MRNFIAEQNVGRFERMLKTITNGPQRRMVQELLELERSKLGAPPTDAAGPGGRSAQD